ncbi:unnamed protein product [Amoebophrya sp. A25]|nr:unnamed protein product [Amoebophrya sp. A25]|eukprot:GSA25T00014875001.1
MGILVPHAHSLPHGFHLLTQQQHHDHSSTTFQATSFHGEPEDTHVRYFTFGDEAVNAKFGGRYVRVQQSNGPGGSGGAHAHKSDTFLGPMPYLIPRARRTSRERGGNIPDIYIARAKEFFSKRNNSDYHLATCAFERRFPDEVEHDMPGEAQPPTYQWRCNEYRDPKEVSAEAANTKQVGGATTLPWKSTFVGPPFRKGISQREVYRQTWDSLRNEGRGQASSLSAEEGLGDPVIESSTSKQRPQSLTVEAATCHEAEKRAVVAGCGDQEKFIPDPAQERRVGGKSVEQQIAESEARGGPPPCLNLDACPVDKLQAALEQEAIASEGRCFVDVELTTLDIDFGPQLHSGFRDPNYDSVVREPWESENLVLSTATAGGTTSAADKQRHFLITLGHAPRMMKNSQWLQDFLRGVGHGTKPAGSYACARNVEYQVDDGAEFLHPLPPTPFAMKEKAVDLVGKGSGTMKTARLVPRTKDNDGVSAFLELQQTSPTRTRITTVPSTSRRPTGRRPTRRSSTTTTSSFYLDCSHPPLSSDQESITQTESLAEIRSQRLKNPPSTAAAGILTPTSRQSHMLLPRWRVSNDEKFAAAGTGGEVADRDGGMYALHKGDFCRWFKDEMWPRKKVLSRFVGSVRSDSEDMQKKSGGTIEAADTILDSKVCKNARPVLVFDSSTTGTWWRCCVHTGSDRSNTLLHDIGMRSSAVAEWDTLSSHGGDPAHMECEPVSVSAPKQVTADSVLAEKIEAGEEDVDPATAPGSPPATSVPTKKQHVHDELECLRRRYPADVGLRECRNARDGAEACNYSDSICVRATSFDSLSKLDARKVVEEEKASGAGLVSRGAAMVSSAASAASAAASSAASHIDDELSSLQGEAGEDEQTPEQRAPVEPAPPAPEGAKAQPPPPILAPEISRCVHLGAPGELRPVESVLEAKSRPNRLLDGLRALFGRSTRDPPPRLCEPGSRGREAYDKAMREEKRMRKIEVFEEEHGPIKGEEPSNDLTMPIQPSETRLNLYRRIPFTPEEKHFHYVVPPNPHDVIFL